MEIVLDVFKNKTGYKMLIGTAAIAAILSACVQTPKDTPSTVSSSSEPQINAETVELDALHEGKSQSAGEIMTNIKKEQPSADRQIISDVSVEYWVKKPGTLVYNSAHEIARSLRLQPKVFVHKEVEGWGLINLEKDEWVSMSDITLAQPEGMLSKPEESTGRPRITVEDMLKAGNK